jgi:hypothetical protein
MAPGFERQRCRTTLFTDRRPALLRFAVAYRFFLLLRFATVLLLFAGLPAAHEIIMGVGFFRRFAADLFTALRRTTRRLRGGFGLVRARCFGALRFLARRAAFWRFVPKYLSCFALILRRAFAICFLFFGRFPAGF